MSDNQDPKLHDLLKNKMPAFLQSLSLVEETTRIFKEILQKLLQIDHSFETHFLHSSSNLDKVVYVLLKTGRFSFDLKYFRNKIEKYANHEITLPPFFKISYGPIETDPDFPDIPKRALIKVSIIFLLHPANL